MTQLLHPRMLRTAPHGSARKAVVAGHDMVVIAGSSAQCTCYRSAQLHFCMTIIIQEHRMTVIILFVNQRAR